MGIDYGKQMVAELDLESINSIEDFCKQWSKIKPILAAAQSILSVLFPSAAAVIGVIITLLDKVCPGKLTALRPGSSSTTETSCQRRCRETYERELAECNGDIDCITRVTGRYAICMIRCREQG